MVGVRRCCRASVAAVTRHRLVAGGCLAVAVLALVLAVSVSWWALVVLPFALVVGVAAWNGIGVATTLHALGDSSNDPGSGPAGLTP